MYLIGLESFVLENDHKLFIPLINTRHTQHTYFIERIPLIEKKSQQIYQLTDEIEAQTNLIWSTWPVTDNRLVVIAVVTENRNILDFLNMGW